MRGRRNLWLLALALLFLGSWWFGRGGPEPGPADVGASHPTAAAPAPDRSGIPEEPAPVHLKVLNGTTEPGLARDFSLLLGRSGCVAENVGNAPHDRYDRTLLINRRLDPARARDLADLFGGVPLLEEWDVRAGEDAVLVLGADHARVARSLEETVAQGK